MKKNIYIALIALVSLLAIVGVVGFIWSYNEMTYFRDSSDEIAYRAAEDAKKQQYISDEELCAEKMKQPYKEFTGPADLGSITFNYPSTWSVYNVKSDNSGYETVFYPDVIPTVSKDTPLALRLEVINKNYEAELKTYDSDVKNGKLKALPITTENKQEGVQFNGRVNEDYTSSFILLKLRDKTIRIQTDTDKFLGDFDDIILPSFEFLP